MNSKFFDVKKEKQDSIINAALRIFAVKGYKDASTDVIVKEAGISKGLLFHYFINKKGLYEFICDYSTKYMTLELTRSVKSAEKDFFEILSQIEMGRCRVARNYPYMQIFLRSARYEKDADAVDALGDSLKNLNATYTNIYAQINPNKFINPQDSAKVVEIIDWINDGFMTEKLNAGITNPDELSEEFTLYLELLRRHFYKSDINSSLSIAKEEIYERDETIMDSMRMEMTFEERLQAGKRPLVELTEEELAKIAEEEEKKALEAEQAESKEANEAEEETGTVTENAGVSDENALDSETGADNTDSDSSDDEDEFFDDEDEEDIVPQADLGQTGPIEGLPRMSTGIIEPIMPTFEAKSIVTAKPLNPSVVIDESRKAETIEDIISEAENNLKDNGNN